MHDPFNEVDSVETLPVHDVDPVQDFAPPIDSFTPGRLPQPEQANAETDITATIHLQRNPWFPLRQFHPPFQLQF